MYIKYKWKNLLYIPYFLIVYVILNYEYWEYPCTFVKYGETPVSTLLTHITCQNFRGCS